MAEHEHDHGATAVAEKQVQTVAIEDAGPARKRLSIEVPAERIQKKIEESFGKLQTEAVLPGFRRGRAPKRLLQRRFDKSIRDEVRGQLISESYTQAIEDEKLDVIGEPEVKDLADIKLPESGPLKFVVEVEISPKVELPPLEGLAVNKPKIEVTDAQVAGEIEKLGERYGRMVEAGSAQVSVGDYLQAEVRIRAGENAGDDAAEISHLPGAYILVNGENRGFKGHVAGIVVDDLGRQLTGKAVGDVVRISMTGPAGHEDERIKGKPITIVIKIDKIERLEPATMESLLQHLSVPSEDELKTRVRAMLEDRRNREQQTAMHEQVRNQLYETVTLELPVGLTGRQASRLLRRQAMDLAYKGASEQDIEAKIAELREQSDEAARKQLKMFFIMDTAAKQLNVEVSEGEVNGRVAMLAMQMGRRPEKLRQQMHRTGEMEQLYLQIREQKTLDKIIESAKVTEVDAPVQVEGT